MALTACGATAFTFARQLLGLLGRALSTHVSIPVPCSADNSQRALTGKILNPRVTLILDSDWSKRTAPLGRSGPLHSRHARHARCTTIPCCAFAAASISASESSSTPRQGAGRCPRLHAVTRARTRTSRAGAAALEWRFAVRACRGPRRARSAGAAAGCNSIVLWRSTTRAPRAARAGDDAAPRAAATDDPRPGARRVDDEAAQEDDEQAQGPETETCATVEELGAA